jgi:Tfp pilus assembly protein FimT
MVGVKVVKRDRGFSLIELTILLSMMAIVAVFSLPKLSSSMRSWQLAADARNIATTLTYAKIGASSQMTHYQLSFNLESNQWSLKKYNRSTSVYDLQGATNALSSGQADSGIAFRSSPSAALSGFPTTSSASITFNSRGIPIDATGKPTANNVIYLSDASDDYAVTVSLSGKVQLWRYRNSQWSAQ